jgi:hypothetical protein
VRLDAAPATWVRRAKSVRFPTPSKPTIPAFMETVESYYSGHRRRANPKPRPLTTLWVISYGQTRIPRNVDPPLNVP